MLVVSYVSALIVQVVVEDVRGKDAQELAEQLPGLVTLEGTEQIARAGSARDYPHLLEKVRRHLGLAANCNQTLIGDMTRVQLQLQLIAAFWLFLSIPPSLDHEAARVLRQKVL